LDNDDFIGRDAILKIKEEGIKRKLVAFVLNDSGFPRKDYEIYKNDKQIGQVTSGTVSPILEKGIGLGYVKKEHSKINTEIEIEVRNKFISAKIIKPPFV